MSARAQTASEHSSKALLIIEKNIHLGFHYSVYHSVLKRQLSNLGGEYGLGAKGAGKAPEGRAFDALYHSKTLKISIENMASQSICGIRVVGLKFELCGKNEVLPGIHFGLGCTGRKFR